MRLMEIEDDGQIRLTQELTKEIPPYAILSHTWGDDHDEVKFSDLTENSAGIKKGFKKLKFCREQAAKDGLRHFWIDSCCINQDSLPELTRSINSMFRWYRNAEKCYVYLSDVQFKSVRNSDDSFAWEAAFDRSRWFTRGWTLQELIAPQVVEFFSEEGHWLGDKQSLETQLCAITNIPSAALRGNALSKFSVEERFSWVATRKTKLEEDKAYCLLGLFAIHLPLIYGEGEEHAFRRLRREIKDCREQTLEPFSTVPYSRNPRFIERTKTLAWLHQVFAGPARRAALVGIGGIGKSKVAIEYTYRVRDISPQTWVFWVHASTAARFEEAYRGIAERLALQGRHEPNVNIFSLVSSWLCDETNGLWLMVLDSVDDIEVFYPGRKSPESSVLLGNYLPQSRNGSILVTSRNKAVAARVVGELGALREICPMNKSQALQLLCSRLGDLSTDDGLTALVSALDCVPLAITQAAAFITRRPRMSVPAYLDELCKNTSRKTRLLSRDLGDLCRDGSASNSVVTTWQISFERIYRERQSAANMLSLSSFFNPQGIPESILRRCNNKSKVVETNEEDTDGDFDDDLDYLQSFSLLTMTSDDRVYEMHSLVQFCTRVWLSSLGKENVWRRRFLSLMAEEFPVGNFENWEKCERLLPHVEPLYEQKLPTAELSGDLVCVLTNAAWYMWQKGSYEASRRIVNETIGAKDISLRQGDPSTLTSTAVLASVLRCQGNYEEAEKQSRWVLDQFEEQQLGKQHPATITALSNLALVLRDQGKLKEAEIAYRQVLDERCRVLGQEHPDTLISISSLALVLRDQGRYREAEELSRLAFNQRRIQLGSQHPSTLTSASNLALVLRDQGNYGEAERIFRQAFAGREQQLGSQHPHTLVSASNLALVLHDLGKFDRASELYRRVLEANEQELGERHPETLTCAGNLASVLQDLGQHSEAEMLNRRVLRERQEELGERHPLTMSSLTNLAFVLREQGKLKESEELSRIALARRAEELGSKHPDTLTSAGNFALVLQDEGKYREAEEINRQAQSAYEAELGHQHPYTLTSLNNLASILQDQGRYDEAEELNRRVLEGRQEGLGRQHPDTLASENNLAMVLRSQGRYEEAEVRARCALAGREMLLGRQHPSTMRSLSNLALILQDRGEHTSAEAMHREVLAGRALVLGQNHPDTLTSATNLTWALRRDGKQKEADQISQQFP